MNKWLFIISQKIFLLLIDFHAWLRYLIRVPYYGSINIQFRVLNLSTSNHGKFLGDHTSPRNVKKYQSKYEKWATLMLIIRAIIIINTN